MAVDLFQQENSDNQEIIITITIKQDNPEHLDISHNLKNMRTMQDAATVCHVLGRSQAMIMGLVKQNMPKQVKKLSKLPESEHIEYMKSQILTFMLNGK